MTDDVQGQGNGHEPGYGLSDVALDALDIVVSSKQPVEERIAALDKLVRALDDGSARRETLRHLRTYARLRK